MKHVAFLIWFLCFSFNAICQNNPMYNYPLTLTYKTCKIETLDWQLYKGSELIIDSDSNLVNILQFESNQRINLYLKDVNKIQVEKGSSAIFYGIMGGLSGFLIGAIVAPNMDSDAASWSVFLGSGVIGFSIGALIGKGNKKYKTIFLQGNFRE